MITSGFVRIAAVGDIQEGTAKVFTVGETRIALCHAEGSFYAIADLCTHDGGPLGEGELVDCQIECPRHGARFDIKTGKALCLPAVVGVPTYKVQVEDGAVYISTES